MIFSDTIYHYSGGTPAGLRGIDALHRPTLGTRP
jgi:hypothetical protein